MLTTKIFSLSIIITVVLITGVVKAQVVYEPVYNKDIYRFLEHLNLKGIIDFKSEIKPLPRSLIAQKLIDAELKRSLLTKVEQDELSFYGKEYFDEINSLSGIIIRESELEYLEKGKPDRFRFFRYVDSDFSFYADPILGCKISNRYEKNALHRWNGARGFGYWGKHFGFSFDFRDNYESGKHIDDIKSMVPETGINILKRGKNSIEYSEVRASITFSWQGGGFTFGKDFINWGSGRGGQIILSSKAPSFPFIRLDLNPVEWLRFSYIHGWLHSGVIDSSTIRTTLVPGRESYSDVDKFIAAHLISFDITRDFTFSLGESVVYSRKIEPIYLIPVMFFRLADHYLGKEDSNTGSNAQVFADASYRFTSLRSKAYSTLFIDELSISNILKGINHSAIGYTIGLETAEPLLANSSLTIEYTKISPFVYMNSDDAELYTNHGYQLGHWIGSNADQIFILYSQRIIRGLILQLTFEHIRKGQTEEPEQQYQLPYPPFLYGSKRFETNFSFDISYQIIHNLFAGVRYQYSDITDAEASRTPAFMEGKKHSVFTVLYYGL